MLRFFALSTEKIIQFLYVPFQSKYGINFSFSSKQRMTAFYLGNFKAKMV